MNLKEIFINRTVFLAFLFLSFAWGTSGQIIDDVKKALETGNAELLSRHFNENLTLNIEGNENEMTSEEARQQMRSFFSKNKVTQLVVKFEGEKSRSNFLIATLITEKGFYRINVFFKKTDTDSFIHLLRIEKVNESSF